MATATETNTERIDLRLLEQVHPRPHLPGLHPCCDRSPDPWGLGAAPPVPDCEHRAAGQVST